MPPELFDLVQKGGAALAPLLLIWGWLERDERKSAQAELLKISMSMVSTVEQTKAALEKLTAILTARRGDQ